jgi:hypothetical protein
LLAPGKRISRATSHRAKLVLIGCFVCELVINLTGAYLHTHGRLSVYAPAPVWICTGACPQMHRGQSTTVAPSPPPLCSRPDRPAGRKQKNNLVLPASAGGRVAIMHKDLRPGDVVLGDRALCSREEAVQAFQNRERP